MGKDIKSEQIEATINENNEMGVFEHRTIRNNTCTGMRFWIG
nr:hypothetical protein P5667_11890 [Bacillus velezensis]